jgi:hypothetical protein
MVLRFVENKYGNVLSIGGGFKQISLIKFKSSFIYEANSKPIEITNEIKIILYNNFF